MYNGGTLTLINCTVSGNTIKSSGPVSAAAAGVSSGTIGTRDDAHADQLHRQRQLRHLTAAACSTSGTATLTNTIVAGNNSRRHRRLRLLRAANNLIGTGNAGGLVNGADGNLVGVTNPLLGPAG